MRPVVKYTKDAATSFGRERQNRLKLDGDGGPVEKDFGWTNGLTWTVEMHGRSPTHLKA